MWWIVGGVVLVALALLIASVMALAGHVRPLRRALRRLRIRAEQAERVQRRSLKLQTSLALVRAQLEEAAERAERMRS
jgi:hypothetical protein